MLPDTGQPYSEKALSRLREELAHQGRLLWLDPETGAIKAKDAAFETVEHSTAELETQ